MKILAGSYEPTSRIVSADIVTKDNSASLMRSLGWGTAGLVAIGPLGLIIGGIAGARRNTTVLAIKYETGNAVLVECKRKEANALLTLAFNRTSERQPPKAKQSYPLPLQGQRAFVADTTPLGSTSSKVGVVLLFGFSFLCWTIIAMG